MEFEGASSGSYLQKRTRRLAESDTRQAMARSECSPSKYRPFGDGSS